MISQTSPQRVVWAIIGCGWVARDYVAPAILNSHNGQLVALGDTCLDAARAIARQSSSPDSIMIDAQLGRILDEDRVEAVYIATPNHCHPDVVERVAQAGRAVLCEKPMAAHREGAQRIVEAVEHFGIIYGTAFDQRHHAAHRWIRQALAEDRLGMVTQVRIHYACWLPPEWSPNNWRVDPAKAGGGAVIDLAPHGIDLISYLIDEPWTDLKVLTQQRIHKYQVDDGGIVIGRTEGGVLGTMQVGYNCPETLPRRTLEILGTGGMVQARNTMGQTPGGELTWIPSPSGQPESIDYGISSQLSPFQAQVEAFADCVLGRSTWPRSVREDFRDFAMLSRACQEAISCR